MSATAVTRISSGRLQRIEALVGDEAVVARVAATLIALHVVDDSFLQPQPGTFAKDHLVSGLVPTLLLVAFTLMYSRVRAGVRAAAAIAFGLFGIAAGVEAAYYAHHGRLSGDDYSGFAALLGGLTLLVVAALTLWQTRRIDAHPLRRWMRRITTAAAGGIVLYLVAVPFLMAYVLTHTARAYVPRDRLGVPHKNVSFTTADGLRLHGWYLPSQNGAAVIAFPGRAGTQKPARLLAQHGYGVLLFDRRGEGESEGDPNAWGWSGYRDVDAAVQFLRRRPDVEPNRIGGIGLSVGGEMMLEAASKSRSLKAVVAEGAGERSLREFLDITGGDKWPAFPAYLALTAGISLFTNSTAPKSLKDLVGGISPTPVLFIYGEHGQDGERNLNPTYYEAAREPKSIWKVPGAGHVGGIDAHPKQYEHRVVTFFDRALLGGS